MFCHHGETLVQIITSDTKHKRNITVEDTLNNHCNTILDTTDKSVGLTNVVNMDISSNGLYSSCSSNTLNYSLYCVPTFYLTWFIATYWANLSLYFDLRDGIISSLKFSKENLSLTNKDAHNNEHNMQKYYLPKNT